MYGVTVGFTPIADSGGPLTQQALRANEVQLVDIYTSDPTSLADDLVMLEDPEGLLLASHVVPLAGEGVSEEAAAVINKVQGALSVADLVALNGQSVNDELAAPEIATQWLEEKALF